MARKNQAPASVVKIVQAMSSLAVYDCLQRGIEPQQFVHMMQEIQRREPKQSMCELFTATRRWLFGSKQA